MEYEKTSVEIKTQLIDKIWLKKEKTGQNFKWQINEALEKYFNI